MLENSGIAEGSEGSIQQTVQHLNTFGLHFKDEAWEPDGRRLEDRDAVLSEI